MMARLKMSDDGYGEEEKPTGEIEIWDTENLIWRDARPEEIVPALVELVIDLIRWKNQVRC